MSDWTDETRVRLLEEIRCMEQPEAQGTEELAADIRAALGEIREWRETARSEMAGRRAAEHQNVELTKALAAYEAQVNELEAKLAEFRATAEAAQERMRLELVRVDGLARERGEEVERLLEAVEQKFPGETRAQTALRYVREAESRANEPGHARAALRGGPCSACGDGDVAQEVIR